MRDHYITLMCEPYDTAQYKEMLLTRMQDGQGEVAILYLEAPTDQQEEFLEYEQVLTMNDQRLCGISFASQLIQKSGYLNPGFLGNAIFELLCRLAKVSGGCRVCKMDAPFMGAPFAEKSVPIPYTYAYVFRSHMEELHKRGTMDYVFSGICALMQEQGQFREFQENINSFLTNSQEYERIAGFTAPFLILRGDDTCGGVLQQFADDLTQALIDLDQAVIEIGDEETDYDQLQGMISKGVVGFQTAALEIDFFKKIRGPKFQFWFDNPLRFQGILRNLPEEYYVLCQDGIHAKLIKEYYHTTNALQFPPGGMEVPGVTTEHSDQERPLDLVFVGGYFEDSAETLSAEEKSFYEYMLSHPLIPFEQGLPEWKPELADLPKEAFAECVAEMKPACRAVIGHFRTEIILTILHAGLSVHVYGEAWKKLADHVPELADRLIIHPQIPPREAMEELKKAKIGLNIMSWHKAGMTERVANILLSGAACLSEETSFLREHFSDGEELSLFRLDELEKLPELIRELLQNTQKRETIAAKGFCKAKKEFSWKARAKELLQISEEHLQKKASIQIFVATHVPFQPPQNPIYIPLHVGKSGKPDLGYLGDDTGENISDLNFLYGELTGLYWIWQNVQDTDYVGLCHYRRYFINDDKRKELQKEEYLALLQEYDAIVPKHAVCEPNYYEHFGRAHNSHDLDAVGRALERLYPEYLPAFQQAMRGTIFYGGNLVVTSLPILKAYAEWLFTIFLEAGEEIDVSGYDNYHKRVYGFLSEQMFYVFSMANQLKVCELTVGISEEKAETKELKEALKRLLADGKIEEARKLFDRQLEIRPDLLLPGSDINHELRDLYDRLRSL